MITNALQNTIHKTESLVPSSNNTAISLWHKFATWQNDMDQCRTLVKNVCYEQDQIRAQINDLLRIREEELRRIKEMEEADSCANTSNSSEIPSLDRLRELQRQLDVVEEQYRAASASCETNKQRVQNTKNCRQDILRAFINANSLFHLNCRSAQYALNEATVAATQPTQCSESCSLDQIGTLCRLHTLHAVLCAKAAENFKCVDHSKDSGDDKWTSKTNKELQNNIALYETKLIDLGESVDDENDPSTWKVSKEKDFELYRSLELYEQQLEKYAIVEKETEQLQSTYDALQNKSLDRDRRMMKLQTQLQRIQGDCTMIESEIDQCKQMISEDEALAHTYRSSTLPVSSLVCFDMFLARPHYFKFIVLIHIFLPE
jgi:hypothetical protein